MQFNSMFESDDITIDSEAEVIFVADLFVEDYVGGAELTTQALIDAAPVTVQKLRSQQISMKVLEQGVNKHWVFCNFSAMDWNLIPSIVANLSYSIVEYDYKYCKYRSSEKHKFTEQRACDCAEQITGKIISALYYGAKSLWWMSEGQLAHYRSLFPFLSEKRNVVLSSVFDDEFFVKIKQLREESTGVERKGWLVLGSDSWIKGTQQAKLWCKEAGHNYEVVWGLPYEELLTKLAQVEGFVYLPQGNDTCPRMVIEAKLLGCKLELNDYVQHKDEEWFATDNILSIEEYLYGARDLFWRAALAESNYIPSISGYTTTLNCIDQQYPFRNCIKSMLTFCDEVVVVDGGSSDGTWEELTSWAEQEKKLKVEMVKRDWDHKRFAVFDGAQKAEARNRCSMDFCWQMDADEVVPPASRDKIVQLCRNWPKLVDLVALPLVEYWGSRNKIRIDVNPWKWRISRNVSHITHGIPKQLRQIDQDGHLYASPGTDGCDYVHAQTYDVIPHGTFYTQDVDNIRIAALQGNADALRSYEEWFKRVIETLPPVEHFSWMDISRKIKTYKNYWQRHWESLYDIKQEDTEENNMFFDKPWSHVTDDEIEDLAQRLAKDTGGHVFHSKIDWAKTTPHIKIDG